MSKTLYDPVTFDLSPYNVEFILCPELWERFNLAGITVDYSKWDCVKMMDSPGKMSKEVDKIPDDCGGIYVYVVISPVIQNGGHYLMYIGKATKTAKGQSLQARVKSYKTQFGDKYNRTKLHKLFKYWGDYVFVFYLPMTSTDLDIKNLEDRLIAAYGKPPCNKEILIHSVKDAVDAVF